MEFAKSRLTVYGFPQNTRVHSAKRSCLKKVDSVSTDCPHPFKMRAHSSCENNFAESRLSVYGFPQLSRVHSEKHSYLKKAQTQCLRTVLIISSIHSLVKTILQRVDLLSTDCPQFCLFLDTAQVYWLSTPAALKNLVFCEMAPNNEETHQLIQVIKIFI